MKIWTKPRVYVEDFVANDYVAVCKGTKPLPTNGNYYADIFDNNANGGYGDYTGPDGIYNGSGFENFRNGNNPNSMTNAAYNPSGRWFYNVTLYTYTGSGTPRMGSSYSSGGFSPIDTYDIYVSKKGVVLHGYPAGTGSQYDPETKPFS